MKNNFEVFIKNLDAISANVIQTASIQKKSYVDVAEQNINEFFQISNMEIVIQFLVIFCCVVSSIILSIIVSLWFSVMLIPTLFFLYLTFQYNKCIISTKVLGFSLLLNNIEKISKD